jgi:hypothetical protein
MPFKFGDVISITGVSLSQYFVTRSTTTTTSTDTVTVSLQSFSNTPRNYWITYTVLDNGNVPIATGLIQGQMAAATYTGAGTSFSITPSTSNNNQQQFTIKPWAYCGAATIEVNVYNQDPTSAANGAVAYCPQATLLSTQTFTIGIPTSQMPTTPS